jgi:hypothetical protein
MIKLILMADERIFRTFRDLWRFAVFGFSCCTRAERDVAPLATKEPTAPENSKCF